MDTELFKRSTTQHDGVHDQVKALVVTVADEIDLLTAERLRSAVAAGCNQLDADQIVIRPIHVTGLGDVLPCSAQ